MPDLKPLRAAVDSMSADLFSVIGIPFENTPELQRQLLAAFAFGMAFAAGKSEGLSPSEVHALSITMLIDSFKYSEEQAGAFAQHLIESASGAGNPAFQGMRYSGLRPLPHSPELRR